MKLQRKHIIVFAVLLILLTLLIWSLWSNTALSITQYRIQSQKLPHSFDGLQIAQVSDLHNTELDPGNTVLLSSLQKSQPDMIAITGDLLDSRNTDTEVAISFVREAVKIAPTYYVAGNHESRIPANYAELKDALWDLGVVVLENESVLFSNGTNTITVTGLLDPDFNMPWPASFAEDYQIVLSHRPELLEQYARQNFDLVLTGHAHGGQFRIPFIGGLYAPHQGFFPQYTSGIHTEGNTTMVISRGLGNSLFPLRFNNRPELILITLESI